MYTRWRIVWLPTKYTLDRSHLPIRGELAAARERANADGTDTRGLSKTLRSIAAHCFIRGLVPARERIECGERARTDRILQLAGKRMLGSARHGAMRRNAASGVLYVENIRG
jgi:hypothetical protein